MGRPEKEITTSNAGLRQLAEWLRRQRAWAGLTYRELADRAGLHATTLQRAASGASVPRLGPVLAYARACDAQPEDARRLWRQARREHVRDQYGRHPAPSPRLVRDFADLSAALRGVYEQAGAPPLRTMEKRAGAFGALPRSSAHRMVNKQMVPHTLDQFRGFLRACEVPADWKVWEDAWNRAWRFEKQEDAGLNEIEIWNADPQWNEPAPPRVLLRQTRRGSEENRQDPVSGEDKAYVTASGPEYYRPLVPRQRSITGRTPVKAVARIVHSRIRSARDPAELRAAELAEEQLHSWAKPVDTETLF